MSENTQRLRRLDALFAERVLGHVDVKRRFVSVATGDDGWSYDLDRTKGSILLPGPFHLPRYTRSLDAAWEGAGGVQFCCRKIVADYDLIYEAEVARADQPTEGDHIQFKGQADHPAEALVLACLRAVGCTEEEIDADAVQG